MAALLTIVDAYYGLNLHTQFSPSRYFIDTVVEVQVVPVELITDLGTENSLAASMQSYLRENADTHSYVSSLKNQRIEGWWSFFFARIAYLVGECFFFKTWYLMV